MFYENSSVFGSLQTNIAMAMSMGIYATSRASSIGSFNSSMGENESQVIGKNIDIICDSFVCE
jgi:hypothetical protein